MTPTRTEIFDTTVGAAACREMSDATDAWLVGLFTEATSALGSRDSVALLAVGGYGRRELAPQSDLDVLLVH
ncbi:MAG: hypothetical protein ACKOQ7_03675, partial [Actinomycetota bacterium]